MSFEINTSLSQSQAKFALMLEKAPYLEHMWDLKKREFSLNLVERYLASASCCEQIMCRFYLMVWLNENQFGFDLAEAIKQL